MVILSQRRKCCGQDTEWSVSSGSYNLVQLISILRNRCPFFFKVGGQRSRWYCHIVEKHCRQDTGWRMRSRIIHLSTIDHYDKCKILIVYQGRRSKVKVVLSHSRKVVSRIQTKPKTPWFLHLGTIDYHDKRKIPSSIVIQGSKS